MSYVCDELIIVRPFSFIALSCTFMSSLCYSDEDNGSRPYDYSALPVRSYTNTNRIEKKPPKNMTNK
jgi:hypothetical protein